MKYIILAVIHLISITGFTQTTDDSLNYSKEQKLKDYFTGLIELKLVNKYFATEHYLKLDSTDRLAFIQKINEAIEKGANKILKLKAVKDSLNDLRNIETTPKPEYDENGIEMPTLDKDYYDDEIEIYTFGGCWESSPVFPLDLYKFISSNVHYPKKALKDSIQGKVYVRFETEKDGSVVNAKIIRGISKELDEEALRVINSMPYFIPIVCKSDELNRSVITLPFSFKLDKK